MILENKESSVVAIGDIQENEVGIDAKNLSHIITILSSNLYSNPEESFLRETISNAWDSHIEAGSSEPIVLSILRNVNNNNLCTISIRDFGTGISPDRFKEIYLNIGSSTKRNSNSYIGAFGIGRFSALSCSNVVHITSYYEGYAYSYIMMKNNDKINIDLVNTEVTTEHNGVDVKITNVPISKYLDALPKLHYMPNLYLNTNFKYSFNDRKILKYENFYAGAFYNKTNCHVLLGNVVYELDLFKFSEYCGSSSYHRDIFKHIEPRFEIGELDVTPNRESLMYTDRTLDAVREKLKKVVAELKAICKDQNYFDFDDFSDYYREVNQTDRYITIGDNKIFIKGTFLHDLTLYTYKGKNPLKDDEEIKDFAWRIYNTSFTKYIYTFDGRNFSGKSKWSQSFIRILYDSPSYDSRRRYNFLLLPSMDGTRSLYFKDWIRSHFRGAVPLMICYEFFNDIIELKRFLEAESLYVRKKGSTDIDWRKTLWVMNQVIKSFRKRAIIKDIVNSAEYIEYKKERSKDARINRVDFGKSITFYITRQGCTRMESFKDIPGLVHYIDTKYKKCTKLYACRDDYRLGILYDVYSENEHIVVISVAKTNLKYLKMLPLNYYNIDSFLTTENKKYMRYLSIQSFLNNTASFRVELKDSLWEDIVRLSAYLPAKEREAIKQFDSLKYCAYENREAVKTALSLLDEKCLDNSFYDLLSPIKKYMNIIGKMQTIEAVTHSIGALYAYFGVKNKLFRMSFKEYKRIKSCLKVEV